MILDTLKEELQPPQVLSAQELPDESWEMVVLKSYLPAFMATVVKKFPGSHIDQTYDPCKPSDNEVRTLGYDIAEHQRYCQFLVRAENMVRAPWPDTAAYYSHVISELLARRARDNISRLDCPLLSISAV
jgi:hypothetical protein